MGNFRKGVIGSVTCYRELRQEGCCVSIGFGIKKFIDEPGESHVIKVGPNCRGQVAAG